MMYKPKKHIYKVIIRALVAVGVGALVVAVVAVTNSSLPPYTAIGNKSYVDTLWPAINKCGLMSKSVKVILSPASSTMSRTVMLEDLDSLVNLGISLNKQVLFLDSSSTIPQVASDAIQTSFRLRLVGVKDLSSAVKNVLSVPPDLSATASTAASVGLLNQLRHLIQESDAKFSAFAKSIESAPGHVKVPLCSWKSELSLLTPSYIQSLVKSWQLSSTLAPVSNVTLLSFSIFPQAVHSVNGMSLLPPTNKLEVEAVVANLGNIFEKNVKVTATVSPIAGGVVGSNPAMAKPTSSGRLVDVQIGQNTVVDLPVLHVDSGTSYVLTVSATLPVASSSKSPGQNTPVSSSSVDITIAH